MEANMNLKKLDTIKTPENWKRELLEQQKITKESSNTDFMKIKRMKWAMASLVLIVVCTMGITVGADTSNPFGEFLQSVFGTKKVQEVHLETTSNIGETNAYKETLVSSIADTVTECHTLEEYIKMQEQKGPKLNKAILFDEDSN